MTVNDDAESFYSVNPNLAMNESVWADHNNTFIVQNQKGTNGMTDDEEEEEDYGSESGETDSYESDASQNSTD